MEYRMLSWYLEYTKKNRKSFKELFFGLSIFQKIAFVGMFAAVFIEISPLIINVNIILTSLSGIILESGCFLFLMRSQQKLFEENSEERLRELDEKYKKLLEQIKLVGYGEKNKIKQLCYRSERLIEKLKNEEEKTEKLVDKIFAAILAPTYITLVSLVFGLKNTVTERILIMFMLLVTIVGIYMLMTVVRKDLRPLWDNTQQDLKDMVDDLHGVLDRCFTIEESDIGR